MQLDGELDNFGYSDRTFAKTVFNNTVERA